MDLSMDIIKVLAQEGCKCIPGDTYGMDVYREWVKWLSYIPEFEKNRRQELESKEISRLNVKELRELKKYKTQEKMANLFKQYGTKGMPVDDYIEVYEYMEKQSISALMISKITKEEYAIAKKQIMYYKSLSAKELSDKVAQDKSNYENISMIDAYALHELVQVNYLNNLSDLRNQIESNARDSRGLYQNGLSLSNNQNIIK